jgi:hypothetical protein
MGTGSLRPNPERRTTSRKHIAYYTRVFEAKSNEQLGNLGDITTGGIMLISAVPFPVNANFSLKIELSDDIANKPFMCIEAQSMWSHPDLDPDLQNTGFRITKISPEDVQIIENIIQAYAIRDN